MGEGSSLNIAATPSRCPLVCLTPVRNEAWILPAFLKAAAGWADRVIVADQHSTDGSDAICHTAPKTTLIYNSSDCYHEGNRQSLLLGKARELDGNQCTFLALDADEMLCANARATFEWQRLLDAAPGTVLRFRWVNLLPGLRECWIPPEHIAFGFVDDGSAHAGAAIHSRRLPWPSDAPVLDFDEIVILHCQYLSWERMRSKQRWYQVWEHLQNPKKRPIQLFRQYNHMLGWKREEMHAVHPEWLNFGDGGPHLAKLSAEEVPWWDLEVLGYLHKYGAKAFRKLDIWDRNWVEVGRLFPDLSAPDSLADPRSTFDRMVNWFLRRTQPISRRWEIRGVQQILRPLGW